MEIDLNGPELDFELDFDLEDFNIDNEEPEKQERICKPRMDSEAISHLVHFRNAEEFAKQVDLQDGARTFAWVDGNFIFGDIIEALIVTRNILPEEINICSLSMSEENIDSLRTILEYTNIKKLRMLLSGYFYSHEKFGLIPYLYDQLDYKDKFQVAFGNYHGKVITIKTERGHTLVIHGSANLRSSNSIEQIMVEVGNRELHDFNARIITEVCDRFGTINYLYPIIRRGEQSWQAVAQAATAEEENSTQKLSNGEPAPGNDSGEYDRKT